VDPRDARDNSAPGDRAGLVECLAATRRGAGSGEAAGMSVPVSQMVTVATYVLKQKLRGRKRYPLVLMLEPLFRCNLACAGCGKIQYPAQILKKHVTVEACLKAVEECGAPIVSIPGGEPLMYPDIEKLVVELVKW